MNTKNIQLMALFLVGVWMGFYITTSMQSDQTVVEEEQVHAHDTHIHPQLEITEGAPVPAVQILANKDAKSGYNLELVTENFQFVPDKVNGENVQNEGHAHLYVNGHKVARLYGKWFHVGSDLLVVGENEILVTLNANDHSDWTHNAERISAAVMVLN